METNKIYSGNALTVLKTFDANTIDCCVTSPPYWGLRDYGHSEQLGSEKHFNEFINNLCNVFDEVYRVLKPTGTCFVNLGDTYNGNKTGNTSNKGYQENTVVTGFKKVKTELPNKSLCMIPERFAIEMCNRGWILRNQIIWHKPNQMPQSCTDRFTVDFEKIFFFTKSQKYYFEQQKEKTTTKDTRVRDRSESKLNTTPGKSKNNGLLTNNYEDKNMRTVWSVNTEPNSEAHFATYPQKLVEIPIKSGCPIDGIVLDPFFGSGTTGIYAKKANRNYIGIELNPEYIKIAEQRLYKHIGMFL